MGQRKNRHPNTASNCVEEQRIKCLNTVCLYSVQRAKPLPLIGGTLGS